MPHTVELGRKARKFLVSQPDRKLRTRLQEAIDGLATDARPPGCLKMKGEDGPYRVRVDDYRIIYQIQDAVLLVLVVQIGSHRAATPRAPGIPIVLCRRKAVALASPFVRGFAADCSKTPDHVHHHPVLRTRTDESGLRAWEHQHRSRPIASPLALGRTLGKRRER